MSGEIRAGIANRFSPFKIPAFTIFYLAQALSLLGSWMQELAKSWLILSIDGKSSSIGALMFAQAIPNLLLVSFAGSLADRYSTKRILVATQATLAVSAAILGVLVATGNISFTALIIIAMVEGTAVAFDVPAFNLVTPQLVPKKDFQQALALNSVNFHLSRVLGPALAGLVMAHFGTQNVFWFNSISFVGLILVFWRLPLKKNPTYEKQKSDPQREDSGTLKEVFFFLRHHAVFSKIMIQFLLLMSLIFPLLFTTMRVLVKERFAISAEDFGLVFAAPGLGALLGSLTFLLIKPKDPLRILPAGLVGVVCGLILIAEAMDLSLLIGLFIAFSFMLFLTLSALLVTVQLQVADQIRGRVSALIGLCFVAVSPVMTVPVGFLSDLMGEREVLWCAALLFGFLSLTVQFKKTSRPI